MRCRTSVLLLPGDEGLVTVPADGEITRLIMPTAERQTAAWLTVTIAGPLSEILEIEGLVGAKVHQQEEHVLASFVELGVDVFHTPCGEHDYFDIKAALDAGRITLGGIEDAIVLAMPHARASHAFPQERLDLLRKLLREQGRFTCPFRPAA